jgi:hypothetical protein
MNNLQPPALCVPGQAGQQVDVPKRHSLAIAAYEFGRLLNQLRWHVEQAILLGSAHQSAEVERVFQ